MGQFGILKDVRSNIGCKIHIQNFNEMKSKTPVKIENSYYNIISQKILKSYYHKMFGVRIFKTIHQERHNVTAMPGNAEMRLERKPLKDSTQCTVHDGRQSYL